MLDRFFAKHVCTLKPNVQYLCEMLTGRLLQLCDTIQNLGDAGRMGEGAEVRVHGLGVEVVPQVEQRVLALDAQLEYLLEIQLGPGAVRHLAVDKFEFNSTCYQS